MKKHRAYVRHAREVMAAFDQLPPAIRAAAAGSAMQPDPRDLLRFVQSGAAEETILKAIERGAAHHLEALDRAHQARHGRPLPHVAAGATFQDR